MEGLNLLQCHVAAGLCPAVICFLRMKAELTRPSAFSCSLRSPPPRALSSDTGLRYIAWPFNEAA